MIGAMLTTVSVDAKIGFEASAAFKLTLLEATLRNAGILGVGFIDHDLFSGRSSGYPFLYW